MSETQIQYVANAEGQLTSILVSIDLWREIESELGTAYLLPSATMKNRLREAIHRQSGIPFEEALKKLGI